MRRFLLSLVVLAWAVSAAAQPVPGKKFETSISGGYQSLSASPEGAGSSDWSLFSLSPRFGVFLSGGFELEAELTLLLWHNHDALNINGNVSYNIPINQEDLLFLLVGYGVSGEFLAGSGLLAVGPIPRTMGVLNLGTGLKVLLNPHVALRAEYRYQRFAGTYYYLHADSAHPSTSRTRIDLSSALLGVSVFL